MKILGIIPARGGSKGIAGKNIKMLAGYPLLAYTALASNQSALLNEIIISSDSEEIINEAAKYNIKAPFVRPAHLADDISTSADVMKHAINFFESENIFFDAVCLLQPTYPFRTKGFIDICIEKFIAENAETLICVVPIPPSYNPYWAFEKTDDGLLKPFVHNKKFITRRQDLPQTFIRDGNIYLIKTSLIKSDENIYSKKISYQLSPQKWYVNIDMPEDWKKAEAMAQEYLHDETSVL